MITTLYADPVKIETVTEECTIIHNKTAWNIINFLSLRHAANVTEINADVGGDLAYTSRVLTELANHGIVTSKVNFKYRYYFLNRNKLVRIAKAVKAFAQA